MPTAQPQEPTTGDEPRRPTVADHIVDRLASWGVRHYYGYPGDGINGMTAALQRREDTRFVQVRHEETAGFAASAHVKYGGGPIGAALVTSGPGAVHLLNGLYDAKLDHQPVVALVGQTGLTAQGGGYYQEVDLLSLYKDVAGFLAQLDDPSQVRHLVDRACRTALSDRTVAVLVLPNDVQDEKAVLDPPHAHGYYATSNAPSTRPTMPAEDDLRAAADVLRGGEKVAMLVGQGALGAEAEVAAIAARLGAGVATGLLGLAAVDQREPWVTGALGLLGTTPSSYLMKHCDRLLIVGSNTPYSEFYPPEGRPAVQIDIQGSQMGLRYPTQVNLTGDAGPTLRALDALLADHVAPTAWREDIAGRTASWRTGQLEVAQQAAEPVNPQLTLTELDARLPDDAMVAVDCGTVTAWYARHLHVRPGMLASLSGTLLSMGGAMPYGIAAKFAHPDRPLFALIGDGAMQMNGVNELITVAKYWKEWADPRFAVLVLNNRDLAFVSWEQRSGEGTPKFDASQGVPDVDYAAWARSLGLNGVRVDDPSQVGPAWDAALAADRPMVIDAVVDPAELMIPPQFTRDQAVKTAMSVIRGDSDWRGILRRGIPAAAATLLPHRG
ncbi:thiamine pyrophosphate-requiring protein [Pseudonocardia sp. KRD-184]|uniref:Thiamine pyrophosphate-requiring protein n=1 Tax=Pseudonocardia oceani TaxID=2792013 RepID=A0ABS6UD15_9PSEU|nr:thiamine pyrophosphate-requiring protein [Pseudonocardia oceani]MBW0092275.1 thiamine pyrophosphate-requiring protein [Pseudonocardia oceani]MBW0099266.1 thiamine pyrophosphate-requiring protein [Pseudonocardia oceani]MBW0111788.1 thiamine pyrophosphate-requiring protein [Pseudonocardia oceani]MBW0125256.1 thiamine pyrophosphate-requiring protein [Pseudonocardia oceani]MBW0130137.1 thiamine pyrophosphate-requiring protein [Pseudonocardia oceani]